MDQIIHHQQEFTVVDIRTTSHLEYLDDFCILGRKVLVFDVAPCDDKVNFSIPFTFDDAMELLRPWPLGAFCDDFAVFDEMHPVGQAFLDASVPYDPETLVSLDIFVDGSTARHEDDVLGSYVMVVTGLHDQPNGPCYSI